MDKKGRCPGETGYTGYKIEPPADFAAFKAAAAAKKATAEVASKKRSGANPPELLEGLNEGFL